MLINDIARTLKPHLPVKIADLLIFIYHRIYMNALCKYYEIKEKNDPDKLMLPSASLRYRVNGSPDIESFFDEGKKCKEDIMAALNSIGKDIETFENILDFGCGCGRTLRWFSEYTETSNFFGADIDCQAIEYCNNYLSNMKFITNNFVPPINFKDNTFDLIYSISVFTHIDEYHQYNWLEELNRIATPDAVLLLSIHGETCWSKLPAKYKDEITKKGIVFVTDNIWDGIFPSGYQSTFHTKEYIFDNYSKYFKLLKYIPQGISNFQDLVILQKGA